jgi:preprotein translocase subunit YajC
MFSLLLLAADSKSSANPIVGFLPIILIGAAMYFLLLRPQRRRMKDAQQLVNTVQEGDEVITNGGIYGFVNAIDGDTIWLDIADNTEIRVHRSAIARKIDPVKEPAGGPVTDGVDAADDDAPAPAPSDASASDVGPAPQTANADDE